MAQKTDVIVIGGGLAGLMAAVTAARAGRSTLLLERGEAFGGHAQTQDWKGFQLNLGGHALYKGPGYALLRELDLLPEGAEPKPRGRTLREGRLDLLPAGPLSMLATGLLGWREKGAFLSLMAGLPRVDLQEAAGLTCRQWLERHVSDPRLRQLLGALLRTNAYEGDLSRLRASTPLRRLLDSQKGVFYIHGGWARLVARLAGAAEAAGAVLKRGQAAAGLETLGGGHRVRMGSGETFEASEVILALPPAETLKLLPTPAAARLRAVLGDPRPVTVSCLDLCLSRLPDHSVNLGLGIDEPVFMVVQSEVARLAPEGAALVHLVRYHEGRPGEEPAAMRAHMEAFMDRLQPGWREVLLHARFLPSIQAASVLDEPGRQRPVSEDLGAPGLHLAGDWVGEVGWLADVSLVSGHRAGLAAAALAACA
ncbi:phytoene desaturase family protein [Geothrix fermentans]|jgi:phytoene dehydrogenase-like protein|uniref:phytoene desaturase family protein n=1 Tax=Geothrix fermentans TaxID=44676 RepID=UPI000424D8AB|nr:FAD-dependent oxidoreductase [Geothrix fermentans]